MDTFSRLSPSALIIEMTYIWLKIKQAELGLKKGIKSNLPLFRLHFCNSKDEIDKQKIYDLLLL